MKRLHCIVRGVVQGVKFRASTRREAQRLGLSGWVKNRRDDTVELVAEGGEAALASLLAWLKRGPPASRVDGVDATWESPQGLTGFTIEFEL